MSKQPMHSPHILDQFITAIYRLADEEGRHKRIKFASAHANSSDVHKLMDRLESLETPVPFDMFHYDDNEEPIMYFVFAGTLWLCTPDDSIPEGSPMILIKT